MSSDEALLAIALSAVALAYWIGWYARAWRISALGNPRWRRLPLLLLLPLCLILLLGVLTNWADDQVRNSGLYLTLFTAAGAVALMAVTVLGDVLGISAASDGIERHNAAALLAVAGLSLATTLCVCGANIGQGPTVGTTLGPLCLAVGALGLLWVIVAALTGRSASIRLDRDRASGLRLAGLLVSWGLVLGRAVAGDWVSTAATLRDFAMQGWPTLPLLGVAVAVETWVRPRRSGPSPSLAINGLAPALCYLASAVLWLIYLGPP